MDYGEAIQVLERENEKFEFPVKRSIDLQSEHERASFPAKGRDPRCRKLLSAGLFFFDDDGPSAKKRAPARWVPAFAGMVRVRGAEAAQTGVRDWTTGTLSR